ncbi:MAG: hypothetical protein ABI686_05395 [Acidobacteriota bacterium]
MLKIQTLIIGRLLIVFLLFALKWMWNSAVLPVGSLRHLLDKREICTLSAQMRSSGD